MNALRQKMIEDMQLHGFAERTQEAYLQAVRQLAKHYRKSPDQIEEEELRQYFLFLKNEKHAARATCTIALCGIKFFFEQTLGREWKTFEFLRPPQEKKLPVVLSVAEVGRVLACVHRSRYRVCLTTIYACGLRLLEGVHLQVKDIDGERQLLHIHQGKGGKDRYVPLPSACLEDATPTLADSSQPALVVSVSVRGDPPTHECKRSATRLAACRAREWDP